MAFKCLECGHIFEDGEEARWTEAHGEQFSGCPLCRGEYEETKPCKHCGSEKLDDELYEGWCEDCLREQITYDTFFDYCEANNDDHYLDIFVMSDLLGGMDCPKWISWDFHQLMIDTYKRRVANAKLLPVDDFLPDCIRFIMDDDGSIGRDNFADWLNGKGVK